MAIPTPIEELLTYDPETEPWTVYFGLKPINTPVLYRFDATMFNTIEAEQFPIKKRTAQGVWIEIYPNKKKFVNLTKRKKYACLSKNEALNSFIKRKRSQIKIITTQLAKAKKQLEAAETFINENTNA